MNKQEARQILQQALGQIKATVQEHNVIQQALIVLTTEEKPVAEESKEPTKEVKQNGKRKN